MRFGQVFVDSGRSQGHRTSKRTQNPAYSAVGSRAPGLNAPTAARVDLRHAEECIDVGLTNFSFVVR